MLNDGARRERARISAIVSSAAPLADELQLRTGGDDGERSARFAITRQAGCLWLRYGG